MQKIEFNPDIEIKFDHLVRHMSQKNLIVQEFIKILKEICDSQIFYSRNLDKFANNISKLMIGKDPLKEAIASKSQQSMQLAKNIKDDMLPFIQKNAFDFKQQAQLKLKQKFVKDLRSNMQKKIRNLQSHEYSYKKSYQRLKKLNIIETRADMQQKQKLQKIFNQREANLFDTITNYNSSIEEYLLEYTAICQKLSDIQTQRKLTLRDAVNKFMIFEISCIKNIEYSIPKYMKTLQKMDDRLIVQEKGGSMNQQHENVVNLAKISINNFIGNIKDDEIDTPIASNHKKILQLKKNTQQVISINRYHQLVYELYSILQQAQINYDVRVLKQVVYFSKNIYTYFTILGQEKDQNKNKNKLSKKLYLLEAVLCHTIFQNIQFWNRYEQKLLDIIQKQGKQIGNSQNKQFQVSLSFINADLQFLKIIKVHSNANHILSKFKTSQQPKQQIINKQNNILNNDIIGLIKKHKKLF